MEKGKKRSITREQFLFYESRTVASLLTDGCGPEEVLMRIRDENLFQYPTERVVQNIAQVCLRRINALGQPELVELLAHGPAEVARQVNLYAIMRENRLVWEFMITVVGEKYRQGDESLTRSEIRRFMMQQQEQDPAVAGWSDATILKCEQVLQRILIDCGYLDPAAGKKASDGERLHGVLLDPALKEGILENGDREALAAFCDFT